MIECDLEENGFEVDDQIDYILRTILNNNKITVHINQQIILATLSFVRKIVNLLV